MNIGIDARLYRQTGVGRYLQNLIHELAVLDTANNYYIFLGRDDYFSFERINPRWKKILLDVKWHTFKEQLVVAFVMSKYKLDVAHFPYFNVPFNYSGRFLLTIHDLIIDHFDTGRASTLPLPLYKFKRLVYKYNLARSIARASALTAISETTKKEIVDHYQVPKDKIIVTYDALDSDFLRRQKTQHTANYFNFQYILYVGNAYPHKNLENLVEALKLIRKERPVKLVLAGNDQYFFPRLRKFVEKNNLTDQVVFFGQADNEQLINLYSYARCLVFPSFMEGFGLPNFEALSCDCLPVISEIKVFGEIWGSDLPSFNPYDISDMAKQILFILKLDKRQYQDQVSLAKKRLKLYSWKNTAATTLKLYESII